MRHVEVEAPAVAEEGVTQIEAAPTEEHPTGDQGLILSCEICVFWMNLVDL